MPLAPRSFAGSAKMKTTLSTWTPLNHQLSNSKFDGITELFHHSHLSKVFEERRNLLAKWFDRWSDSQRRAVLQDLVLSCSVEQLMFLSHSVSRRLPLQAADFTCLLPRALCLYVFSFLDPRSLCRCAQVSWCWKSIVELDQLWMPKCLRLGWCINFSPTPFEQGVWKQHYIQTVQELRQMPLQTVSPLPQFVGPRVPSTSGTHEEHGHMSELNLLTQEHPASSSSLQHGGISKKKKQQTAPAPWRDSDIHPKDTLRFNYLDNLEPSEPAIRAHMKSRAPTRHSGTRKPDGGNKKTLSEASYKLRKAKSLMFLSSDCRLQDLSPHHHDAQSRPSWAARSQNHPITKEMAKSMLGLARWNSEIRPGPVRSTVPRLSVEALKASQRSHRSTPGIPLFDVQPWTAPASHTHGIRSESHRPHQEGIKTTI